MLQFAIGLLTGLLTGVCVMGLCVAKGRDNETSWTMEVKAAARAESERGNNEKAEGMRYALEAYYRN